MLRVPLTASPKGASLIPEWSGAVAVSAGSHQRRHLSSLRIEYLCRRHPTASRRRARCTGGDHEDESEDGGGSGGGVACLRRHVPEQRGAGLGRWSPDGAERG